MPGPRFENKTFCLPGGNSDEYVKNYDAVFGRDVTCTSCGRKFRTKTKPAVCEKCGPSDD